MHRLSCNRYRESIEECKRNYPRQISAVSLDDNCICDFVMSLSSILSTNAPILSDRLIGETEKRGGSVKSVNALARLRVPALPL